uniref:BACK domain-containing protein n=1 Tax=Parascaris univalens TaxID=6257 RepID=A0A914ZGG6_PARUN
MSSGSSEDVQSGEDTNNVRLITSKRTYDVKISDFAFYSLKIRKLAEMDKVPTKINLSPYDDVAVRTLVGYINGDDQSNIDISFYALADLLDLARSLFIINLLRQLENALMSAASQSTDGLLQSMIIVGKERLISGGLLSRRKIEALAASAFPKVARHKNIGMIPAIIFANLIARCDLDIKSEMEVVDAGLVWIWKQKNRLAASQLVFSRIRSAFLSPGDKSTIRQRVKALWEGEKVLPLVASMLSSSHCRRCCMIKEHIENRSIRCGVPPPLDDNKVNFDKLPLSIPSALAPKKVSKSTKPRKLQKSQKKGHSSKRRSSSRGSSAHSGTSHTNRSSGKSSKISSKRAHRKRNRHSNQSSNKTRRSSKKRSSQQKSHSRHSAKQHRISSRSRAV